MKNVWIALSGGMDSVVLAHFLTQQFAFLPLRAVHVNHHLQGQADAWEHDCATLCQQLRLPLEKISITVQRQKNESLEAAARRLRYAALQNIMQSGDIIITAHHLDDQAETVLLQLLRGAGLRGVSAMPTWQVFGPGYLLRPLLPFSRPQLQQYAHHHTLSWAEDPSNADTIFDRNFLRHHITPVLQQRWPQAPATLARFARHCAEQEELLTILAAQDYQQSLTANGNLSIAALQTLTIARRHNILRYALRQQNLPIPQQRFLQAIDATLMPAKIDANPLVYWPGAQCRRFRGQLFLLPHPYIRSAELSAQEKAWCQQHLPDMDLKSPLVEIKFRRGGEYFQPETHRPARPLKKWFQEWHIPPWQRDKIPLIFVGEKLIAVVGYQVTENRN